MCLDYYRGFFNFPILFLFGWLLFRPRSNPPSPLTSIIIRQSHLTRRLSLSLSLLTAFAMSSSGNQISQSRTPPIAPPRLPPPSKWKPLFFRASTLLALLLAIALNLPYQIPYINSPNPLKASLIQTILSLLPLPKSHKAPQSPPSATRRPCVLWMAPFLSGGGYSSEAWSYITSLHAKIPNPAFNLRIEHHGDLQSSEFWHGLPEKSQLLAYKLHGTECRSRDTIVVCHSEPGAWFPPLFQTMPCPPSGYKSPAFVVGRTMFETDRLTPEHVRRCNRMDQVWVPTDFHVSTFVQSGVEQSKVVKVVQPVDVEFFDPAKHETMVLPAQEPILRSAALFSVAEVEKKFVFLSIFKWELRKGWDVLLKAYLREFSKSDGVMLCLLISAYHSDTDFAVKIRAFAEEQGLNEPADRWALVQVIDVHIPQLDLPKIYRAADAFVLPSRGEGWGRPIVEAMAMGLPVIATNWSGPTEYLTEENGYLLPLEGMAEVPEGPFEGHLWAEPSVDRLRTLMRHLLSNPEEGRRKGLRAREDMMKRFSPEVVAQIVADRIMEIWSSHNHSIYADYG